MFDDHDRVRVINIHFCLVPIPLHMQDNDVTEFIFDDMDDPPVKPETQDEPVPLPLMMLPWKRLLTLAIWGQILGLKMFI